jgi:hypothetical protein
VSSRETAKFCLQYHLEPQWPPLAWLAELRSDRKTIALRHGSSVEITREWCCEAVWEGDFVSGDFDRTDIVVGSGVRVREAGIVLVSSGSTVDRLQALALGDRTLVSNSLVCLLTAADASLDPANPDYATACFSVVKGLDRYVRTIPCSKGQVEFTYFDNLYWDGRTMGRVPKPNDSRRFDDFADYRGFLSEALSAMVRNMGDDARQRAAYRLLGTLSTGYDSTMATALLKPLGLERVLCFERPGQNRDDGKKLAPYLEVEPMVVDVNQWRSLSMPEIPFLAGDSVGEEVHYKGAEEILRGRLLVTGYHGDKVWERNTPYTASTLIRGDMSGMSLTEYRLWTGFIHCPIPFFGARQIESIKRISNSDEMKPWDIGGDYNRPISRRIVEQAGVPREAFGTMKSFASRWFVTSPDFLTEDSAERFSAWLKDRRSHWWQRGQFPPLRDRRFDRWRLQVAEKASDLASRTPGFYRLGLNRFKPLRLLASLDMNNVAYEVPLFGLRRYLMPWAVEEAKLRYPSASPVNSSEQTTDSSAGNVRALKVRAFTTTPG